MLDEQKKGIQMIEVDFCERCSDRRWKEEDHFLHVFRSKNKRFFSFNYFFQQNKTRFMLAALICWALPLNLWTGVIIFEIFEKMFYHNNFYAYHKRDIAIFIATGMSILHFVRC